MLYEYIYDSIIYSMYVFFLSCLYARLRAVQVPLKITTVKLHFSWNYQEMCQINYCKIMISVKCNICCFFVRGHVSILHYACKNSRKQQNFVFNSVKQDKKCQDDVSTHPLRGLVFFISKNWVPVWLYLSAVKELRQDVKFVRLI